VVGAVRAFKQDAFSTGHVSSGHRFSTQSIDEGPYRLRPANDAPWANYGYGRREGVWQKLGDAATAVLRLVVPVLVLLGCISGVFLYRDIPAPVMGLQWISVAHLFVALGFFCVFMTNRRYGPANAFAQVVITSALVVLVSLFGQDTVNQALVVTPVPMIEAVAFGAAFFLASFVSIIVFDGARGAYWFSAPLFGFVSAAIVFPAVYFPISGVESAWLMHAVEYAGVLTGEGVLLLIPFYLLRGIIPPLAGFGGY
jgi:hypothetical protein